MSRELTHNERRLIKKIKEQHGRIPADEAVWYLQGITKDPSIECPRKASSIRELAEQFGIHLPMGAFGAA